MAKKKPQPFWALIFVYTPFIMGGDVWQKRRYLVTGEDAKYRVRGKKREGFTWFRNGEYMLHDKATGGLITKAKSVKAVIKKAEHEIADTPDFLDQAAKIGLVMHKEEIPVERALRLLDIVSASEKMTSKKKEVARV